MKMIKYFAAILSLCIPAISHADERYLGKIVSGAGADTTNGSTAAPFIVPTAQPISIQCTAAAYVITDDTTAVDTDRGIHVSANQFLTTKTSTFNTIIVTSTVSAIIRIAGPAAVTCSVWTRRGDE